MSKNSSYNTKLCSRNKWVQFTCTCLFLLFTLNSHAQNLVPNGGFEFVSDCSQFGDLRVATPWYCASYSPDRFSPEHCFGGMPDCYPGSYQYSRNGVAHAGYAWKFNVGGDSILQEIPAVGLMEQLKEGGIYHLEFFVSHSIYSSPFSTGTNCIQAAFSADSALYNWYNKNDYLRASVWNPRNVVISDTLGWTKVEGDFVADGHEKFILIGCFDPIDSIYNYSIGSGGYMFIDDVSLVEISVPETPLPFNVFPNPNNGLFTVTYTLDTAKSHQLIFYNTIGQLVYSYELNPAIYSAGLDLSALSGGMYLYTLVSDGKKERSGKMVIVK